jgi:tetratricopeptide (TPR) repeat protein
MSLLLDAMKKSDGTKDKLVSIDDLQLEEIQPSPARPVVGAQAESPTASVVTQTSVNAPASPSKTTSSRAAGENLFAAKKTPPKKRRRLGIVPIALIGGGLFAVTYGSYVYIQITPPNQRFYYSAPPPQQHIAAPVITPPRPLAVAPAAPLALAPLTPVPEISAPVKVPEKPLVKLAPKANIQANNYVPKKNAPQVAKPYKQNNSTLEIQHKPEPDSIDPILTSAYLAYQKGDYETSGKLYREALSKDSKNRDTLLGLAAIAQQQGQDDAAMQFYRRVLSLDPHDPIAQAALTSFGPGDPAGKESHLKQLIAQQPDSAALNFALANQYADQSRWAEAQQAYFYALSLEPTNALFAFNLAISLDHIGQRNTAAQYYRQALQFDTSGNSGFNRDQAQQRLNQIGSH